MATLAKAPTVTFEVSTDAGSTYNAIPGVLSFDPGAITAEEIDATDSDSTGAFREFINGYSAASEGTISVHNAPGDAVLASLRAAVQSGAELTFRTVYGTETKVFQALVKGYADPVTIGEKMVVTVTIKLTGEPTYS